MKNTCSILMSLACASSLFASSLLGAPRIMEETDLFEVGQEGYLSYRIPAIAVTKSGTVLAFTSARKAVSDWAEIVIMMRRSLDNGKTWEERRIIASAEGKKPVDNPVVIADQKSGRVHFLYQINYANVYYMYSDDDGATFSTPVKITAALETLRPQYNWNVVAPGPGHGIQLKSGRLIVPTWLSTGGKRHRPSVVTTLYSDDNGQTWKAGEIVPDTLKNLNETAAVELDDGRVALFLRNEEPGAYAHAISISKDGVSGWSKPEIHKELYSPICFATVLCLTDGSLSEGTSRLLFVHPDSRANTKTIRNWGARPRENLTLRLSYDNGQTWGVSRVLYPGRTGYADLALGKDNFIYCLYERGEVGGNNLNTRYLTIARFNLEWLTDSKDTLGSE